MKRILFVSIISEWGVNSAKYAIRRGERRARKTLKVEKKLGTSLL